MFTTALDEWLPNFQTGTDPVITTPTGTATGTAANASSSASTKSKSKSKGKDNSTAALARPGGPVVGVAAALIAAMIW
jgi:hypothetical protein